MFSPQKLPSAQVQSLITQYLKCSSAREEGLIFNRFQRLIIELPTETLIEIKFKGQNLLVRTLRDCLYGSTDANENHVTKLLKILECLIFNVKYSNKALLKAFLTNTDTFNSTPLNHFLHSGQPRVVHFYLRELKAVVTDEIEFKNLLIHVNQYGSSPLGDAVSSRNIEIFELYQKEIKILCQKQILTDDEVKDLYFKANKPYGYSPLGLSLQIADPSFFNSLLKIAASALNVGLINESEYLRWFFNEENQGFSNMQLLLKSGGLATASCYFSVIRKLCKLKPEIKNTVKTILFEVSSLGYTPWHQMANCQNLPLAKSFIEFSALFLNWTELDYLINRATKQVGIPKNKEISNPQGQEVQGYVDEIRASARKHAALEAQQSKTQKNSNTTFSFFSMDLKEMFHCDTTSETSENSPLSSVSNLGLLI